MNKEQAQKLIERLSGNNKDMFLGDVLELITTLPRRPTADPTAKKYILYKEQINLTVLYWSALGLNKPLQTILDEAEQENAQLKYRAIELFQFLEILFPNNTHNDTTNEEK